MDSTKSGAIPVYTIKAWIDTPVIRVAILYKYSVHTSSMERASVCLPISKDAQSDPKARKNEYIVMVRRNMNSRLMKNWDAVRERFAMLLM